MKQSIRTVNRLSQRQLLIRWSWGITVITFIIFSVVFLSEQLADRKNAAARSAGMTTFRAGSFIVNMGWSPQSVNNGLKPYGMIYDLVNNYNVPVSWIINPSKIRDGNDFSHEGYNYRGGTFVIPGEFISPAIANTIALWQVQGIMGRYAQTPFSANVYDVITSFPKVIIDTLAGRQSIILTYFANAGIPATAYQKGTPASLAASNCADVWVAPEEEPTWAGYAPLYDFVTVQKGWVFTQSHTVSMMEGCFTNTPTFRQLNFLSTGGLKCFTANSCYLCTEVHLKNCVAPITYYFPSDPIMQFTGDLHQCCAYGSEQFFQPVSTGSWYPSTRRGITTSDGVSPKEGSVLVYGPAFGNVANGQVLYIAGPNLAATGTAPQQVSAQRAFFNFILLAGMARRLNATAIMPKSDIAPGDTSLVAATGGITYQWTSSLGGTFVDPYGSTTTYQAPTAYSFDTLDVITVRVSDGCGRSTIITKTIKVWGSGTLPVTLVEFNARQDADAVRLYWITASESNNDHFLLEKSLDAIHWNLFEKIPGAGNSNSSRFYSTTDEKTCSANTYYRLSQVDYDGRSDILSTVRLVSSGSPESTGRLRIENNIFSDDFKVRFNADESVSCKLWLYDLSGKLVDERDYSLHKGEQVLTYEAAKLQSAIYLAILCTNDRKIYSGRIIKL